MVKIISLCILFIFSYANAGEKVLNKNENNNTIGDGIINFINISKSEDYFTKQKSLLSTDNEINLLKKVIVIYDKNSTMTNEELEQSTINSDIMYDDYNYQTFILYLKSILF